MTERKELRERVTVNLDPDLIRKLRILSEQTMVPISRMVEKAVKEIYSEQLKEIE